ncbi:Mth938-like domain-containing protein [archaeon]|nr:Mth938-like domain-containing protein [archaeon]
MPPRIEAYSFGRMRVDGREYSRDLIILPTEIQPNWWRKEGHSLCVEDLEYVMKYNEQNPLEVLVIGTGYMGCMRVPSEVVRAIEERGIKVIVTDTRRAVDLYNQYASSGKRTAGAFHLTC